MDKEFFKRGVEEIIEEKSFAGKLKAGAKLRIKLGVDPTRPDIHLGHTVSLLRLKELQDDGHTIIFLIGDYTALVGDPSGKSKTRPMLSAAEVKANAKTYLDQVGKILDTKKTEIRQNSEWFAGMKFDDVLRLGARFTVAQIIERDDFTKRLASGADIGLQETLYPVMQAYDSVMLKADVEVGGTDQKFNMLAGRSLQRKTGDEPQDVITFKLLVGLDGKEKMSKSLGNYVGIVEGPNNQFGKLMSISDDLIIDYFRLCTRVSGATIGDYEKAMAAGENPRDYKERLAREIVLMYHGEAAAKAARDDFIKRFRLKKLPENIPQKELTGTFSLVDLLTSAAIFDSKSKARRIIEQGGVKIDGERITDSQRSIVVHHGMIVQIGPRDIYQLV